MKEKRNIKNIFQIVFTFFAFFIFGAINVNAEVVTVYDMNTFLNEFKNKTNTSDIVQLKNDIDMSDINYQQNLVIYKDKTIDLKGNTLILPRYLLAIQYNANATVKFIDSSSGKTGKILGADNSTGAYPLIKVFTTASSPPEETFLVFDGVKIERNTDVGGFVIGPGTNETKIKKVSFINTDITNFEFLNEGREANSFYYENITFKRGVSTQGFLIQENISVSDVISEDSKIIKEYRNGNFKQEYSSDEKMTNVYTDDDVLKVIYKDGFKVSNVDLNETYGYTDDTATEKAISIKNRGTSALQIKNVSVNNSNFEIVSGVKTNLAAGKTDTSWKIKAKPGLRKGVYTATITVTDMSDNTYTSTVTLTVVAKELTGLGIGGVNRTIAYQEAFTPTLTGATELGSGDYTIKYAQKDGENYSDISYKPFKVGKYKVTISVTNENYVASDVSVEFEIVAKKITPTVNAIPDQTYTGEQITPNVSVGNGSGITFIKDTDYTVEYGTNINAGEGKVTIKAISGNNFTWDDKEVTFNIVAKKLTDSNVTLEQTSFRHTGGEIEPEPVVKDGEKTLELGTDYELSYDNNKNIGNSAVVKVIGKGNYQGEVTKPFSIVGKEVQEISFTDSEITKTYGEGVFTIEANSTKVYGEVKYTSSNTDVAVVDESTGEVTIKGAGTAVIKATASETADYAEASASYTLNVNKLKINFTAIVDNKEYDGNNKANVSKINLIGVKSYDTLVKDTDYTVSALFSDENYGLSKNVTVKITLKKTKTANNYELEKDTYNAKASITGRVIKDEWVEVAEDTYTYNGTAIKPVVTVKDPTGETVITLTKDTHYRVEYTNNINAGKGKIKIIGRKNYTGEIEKEFTINKKSINPKIDDIPSVIYNGSEHRPNLVVKDGSTTLGEGTDYNVEYSNNLRAGDAYAEISSVPTSNYTFATTGKNFTIEKYKIKESDVTLEYTSVVGDGNAKKPNVTVKMGNEVIPPVEYNVDYEDNTNIGTAKVIVTIKTDSDDFTGTVTKKFEIVDKTLITISGISDQQVVYTGSPVVLNGTLTVSNGINPQDLTVKWYKGSEEITRPTDVGEYKVVYSYEDDNYIGSLTVDFEITKKESVIPTLNDYSAVVGDKLSSITLPNGFKWIDGNEVITSGSKKYNATYTENNDTNNYTTKNVEVNVYGKVKVNLTTSVNGVGGTISSSKNNILEGTTETITLSPSVGFEISKVEVNGVDKTSSINNNKLDIIIENSDVNVVVTYKAIQYTITINDLEHVTINPSGIIKVDYNTNKTFTIMAELGYKLVSVKVNGVEMISSIVNDELTLENILSDTEIVVVVERNIHKVIEGANQKYIINESKEARFKIDAKNYSFERGGSVYVDGVLVDTDNYTSEDGNIIVLKKKYLDNLSEGEHTLKVVFVDGEASTTFTVVKLNKENPKTGDNIVIYILTGIVSTLGLAGVYFYKRKQTN